jgi:pimeloyl-ACP methyl ester carboxylesterase
MTPRTRRGWWIAAAGSLLILLLPLGCTMFAPQFEPAIDTPEMRANALASRFAEGAGGRIHFVVAGQPPTAPARVLFVHGSPGTWDGWKGFLEDPELRAAAHLIAVDRLGFGGSERGRAVPSLAAQAAALARVLEHGEPSEPSEPGAPAGPPAVVVGHSLGGPIAARLAMDRPDLVAGLLLIAPSIDPAEERHRWYNVAAATVVVQWFLPTDWTTSNRELWPLKRELTAMLPLWSQVRCPVTVVQGLADDLVPAGNSDFAERELPPGRVRIERYPGEDHFILWKRPAAVREPLIALLAGATGASGASGATVP